MDRNEILAEFTRNPPQILIVGGGINGAGTFLDLALNGVRVLLVDKVDFCSGASAASSHMAHGGIRYLENGEFRLVREAVQERNRMIRNAPHLVHPLPTTIPIFKIFSGLLNAPLKFLGWLEKPSERGALVIKLGLIFYDAFTRSQKTVPPHRFEGRKKSLQRFPGMHPKVRYTATYYDGSILSPERLVMEILLDAESTGEHARAINYVSFQEVKDGKVVLQDEITGITHEVSPQLVINASGPWIDMANQKMGMKTHYIGGTKGSHLVLAHAKLKNAIAGHEIFFENQDGRIVLIFPLGDKILLGTSDLSSDDPDSAICTQEEEGYFIDMLARVFPGIKVNPEDIIFRFSGVRPLAYTQAKLAGQITRDHHIQQDFIGNLTVFSLVGGKWTSYRVFSEQVTDKSLEFLGIPRIKGTSDLPIGGGQGYPLGDKEKSIWLEELVSRSGLDRSRVETLFFRYGTRAGDVAEFIRQGNDLSLKACPSFSTREIIFLIENEKVLHLDDLLLRRTLLAFQGQVTRPLIEELASVMGSHLGWNAEMIRLETKRSLDILASRHGLIL